MREATIVHADAFAKPAELSVGDHLVHISEPDALEAVLPCDAVAFHIIIINIEDSTNTFKMERT